MVNAIYPIKKIMALSVFFAFTVNAETGTGWDLDQLQKERVLYEAKAAVNKAKAEAEAGGVSSNVTLPVNPYQPGTSVVTSKPVDSSPQLVKINGKNAVISMGDGNTTTVSTGQMLPGGRWQVLSVSLAGVKIKNISTQRVEVLN